MKWFEGSINEAVTTSKSRKAVFVVFVTGENEASSETARVIDSPAISSRLEQDDFVCIQLTSGTESYEFFAQIYKVVPVPSLFFIGTNGTPLEIIASDLTEDNLRGKIDSILERAGRGKSPSSDFVKGEQLAGAAENTSGPSSSGLSVEETSQATAPSEEDKIERAKRLIELQRQQKAEKDKEDEKRRELERRKMGRDVQLARQKQQELEVTLALEERAKEKALEFAARQRVKQQIAQDKLERKQREQELVNQQQQQMQERSQPVVSTPADGSARIQFRLPSGSSHLGKFQATDTLRDLRSFVTNNIELPFRQFSMSTSFPRRDLSAEDDSKTVTELELVPTAVVLIIPVKTESTVVPASQEVGFLSQLVWTVFSPILTVYNYISSYFMGPRGGRSNRRPSYSPYSSPSIPRNRRQNSGLVHRNLGGRSLGGTVRAGGSNIYRLHSGRDDNDENNTWNGNSTQQM